MSSRSRLINLMAQREAAQLAEARRGFAAIAGQHSAADSLCKRLTELMDHRRHQTAAATSVAQLREHRHLSDQLAVETERNSARAAQLAQQMRDAAAAMAKRDHRKRVLDEAAQTARRAEQLEREMRSEAAQNPRPRR